MEHEMEFTREIYWNVGHGFLTLGPMYLLALAAIGMLVYGFLQRIKVYRQGHTLQRTDHPADRVIDAVKTALLQTKVTRVKLPGLFHGLFFWGFFLLFIGTTLIVIQADFTDLFFGVKFLKGNFYKLFSITLDIAGLVAIVMLAALAVRRYIFPPKDLVIKKDDALMHGLMLVILITGFVIEGARIAVTELGTPLAPWSPVGLMVARALAPLGEEGLRSLHRYLWWFHLLLVMGFIVSIPFTKFRHIFTTSINRFFAVRGPGKLSTLDLEDEEAESFGVVNLEDYTWKDIFDADACTICMRCQDRCPAWNTDKPLSPMKIVNQIGEMAFNEDQSKEAVVETFSRDAIWACTTCRACQDICPASIEHIRKIIDVRRSLVLMEGEFPGEEVMAAMEHTEVNGNPLGLGYASRGDWAEDLDVRVMAENSDVDILYFVGCYGSFDKRNIKIAKSFITLCNKAGVKVGILGKEEKCCGEPMRKMGNEYLYQTMAQENIETIKGYGVKKIVTTCPHCFDTLAKDYIDLGFADFEVVSYTVFLEELIKEGKLRINSADLSCTYHDSCYLGRHNNIYDAPRNLIAAAGGKISEMDKSRDQSFCCSAGGGRILAEENIGERINIKRVRMAAETGADVLISNCPFCLTMFEDGIKGAELEGSMQPKDIAEILVERVEN
nr:heterodisulfide reductase-related iron-sulfur binding cluster [Desulfopila inferna]